MKNKNTTINDLKLKQQNFSKKTEVGMNFKNIKKFKYWVCLQKVI